MNNLFYLAADSSRLLKEWIDTSLQVKIIIIIIIIIIITMTITITITQ